VWLITKRARCARRAAGRARRGHRCGHPRGVEQVADQRGELLQLGQVAEVWIAAVAAGNDLPVVTQDSDYAPLESIGGPHVIRI